jgi:hypothetical protein
MSVRSATLATETSVVSLTFQRFAKPTMRSHRPLAIARSKGKLLQTAIDPSSKDGVRLFSNAATKFANGVGGGPPAVCSRSVSGGAAATIKLRAFFARMMHLPIDVVD